ncbi:MAG: DNA polymerase III subunit gamma/tau [Ignavibacteriales bacterium]|nr:DNA polymerase III subunit gamma/tau [Ignavibacteriales bacterium]
MSYQVTARKWRPMVFEDVVGQAHITNTLKNALATKRVAHAYIFSGTRGVGKTTTARILAKALNCLSPSDNNPDNTCAVCEEITLGRSLDVIEIDGASNRGVEEIRNLRESVRYTPTRGKYKVYIIDEVHMLTKEAFNALLKTLEEPPPHVLFIFATTEAHKVPMTILSRCQRFDFRRIAIDEIINRLRHIADEEKVRIEDDALLIIAKKGDGSLRDAQSIFDQVRSFCGNDIKTDEVMRALNVVDQEMFFRVTSLIAAKDVRAGVELVDEIVRSGCDLREFVSGLSEHLRNLLIVLTTGSTQLVETSEPFKKRYEQDTKSFTEQDIVRLMKLANELESSIRWAPQPRFKLEATLLQMVRMDGSVRIQDLLQQINDLKKKLDGKSFSDSVNARTVEKKPLPSTEVKVLGSVSAGTLKASSLVSAASQYKDVQSSSPFMPAPGLRNVVQEHVVAPTTELNSSETAYKILSETVIQRWNDFVDGVRKTKIAIGTSLSASHFLESNNGTVRIGCPDEYHLSSLKRNKEFLAEVFQNVTGVRVSIEPVIAGAEQKGNGSLAASQSSPATAKPGNGANPDDHPVIAAIKRELGGELIR